MANERQVESVAEEGHDMSIPGGDDKSPAFKKMAAALDEHMKPFKAEVSTKPVIPDPGKSQPPQEPATKEPKPADEKKPSAIKTFSSKPVEKPADIAPAVAEDEIEVPASIKSGKAADDWKKAHATFREREKALQAKMDGVVKELETLRTQPRIDPKEIETIKSERDKLQEKLETVALERSERFQKQYSDQLTKAAARAKNAVGDAYAPKIEALISLPASEWRDEQINKIREELTGVQQGRLDIAVADMDKIRDDMQSALADSKNRLAQIQEQERLQAEQSKLSMVQAVEQNVAKAMELAKQSSAFSEIEGDEEHNKSISERIEKVKKFFKGEVDPEEMIKIPLLAEENLWLNDYYIPKLTDEIEQLKEQLEAIGGSKPNLTSRQGGKTQGGKMSFTEKFMTEFNNKVS